MRSTFSSFRSDKPHSSISEWVEILSGENYQTDDLDGIPELVDSINLQAAGPGEANRALRKKLKYGNVHRQLRALTILKALVENAGPKFAASFADGRMNEQLKSMASGAHTDSRVRKRLISLLTSWHHTYKDDSNYYLRTLAGVYPGGKSASTQSPSLNKELEQFGFTASEKEREREKRERKEKEEERKRLKAAEREKANQLALQKQRDQQAAAAAARKPNKQRKPFNFEQEKPNILSSIANASQASNNLINALKLVNREKESIEENTRVQETLAAAKAARKAVVRYVQLVENEELIGTLIDTNERIIAALEMYDLLLKTAAHDSDDTPPASPAASEAPTYNSQLDRLQEKQRTRIARHNSLLSNSKGKSRADPHPDLEDLRFGADNESVNNAGASLPRPLSPSRIDEERHGSLSDYSDYDSSADERAVAHTSAAGTSKSPRSPAAAVKYDYKRRTGDVSNRNADNEGEEEDEDLRERLREKEQRKGLLIDDGDDDDPFADPFSDAHGSAGGVGTPGIVEKKPLQW